jgi:probable F420-dependent oxidoreductase
MRPFRFGFQSTTDEPAQVLEEARRAEQAGFDIFQVGDHIGTEPSPLVTLAAVAGVTQHMRLGTLVLNNDLRHPVALAQELATLDHLCGGRLEVGIGAGHSFTEYQALGLAFDGPAVRKERLAESVEILRSLLDGVSVTRRGRHYALEGATTLQSRQAHVPLLVGVNGRTALAHAACHADIVAPTMLGRTLADGQHHEVRWEADRLDRTAASVRSSAGAGWPSLEMHALVQQVMVTPDRRQRAEEVAQRTRMTVEDILATPYLCLGTHEDIAEHLIGCRERWGIGYFSVRSIDAFAPVIGLLREEPPSRNADHAPGG